MKIRLTAFIGLIFLIILFFGSKLSISKSHITTQFNSQFSKIDTFDLNTEEFIKQVDQLHEELEVLRNHKFKFEFDSDEFKEGMKPLAVELKNLKLKDLHIELNFDSGEFKKNMEELAEELRNQQFTFQDFEFDMSEFKEEMKEFKEEMKKFNIDFKDLNMEMEKLNGFLKDLKIEMRKDNLIDDEDEEINLKLNNEEIIVNGNRISEDLFRKYIELYEDHFGQEPGENTHIHIN